MRPIAATILACALTIVSAVSTPAPVSAQAPAQPNRKPDLGDAVEGVYQGDVISDARGSSQSDVTITVKRVGKNLVEVSSDYPRIPTVTIPLSQAMSSIVAARGNAVFLIDRAKDSKRLDLTIDDASLVVRRP
ncbi:hypothetical protein [Allosphingosinicella deserti]|uniref:hypothetical protein n=1 Tax=Allosphingosinicella deserti TaxID=2116704 RepID=UPI000D0ABF72|nr:hypothetical protein [Sphingomonas deserti]